MESAYVDESEYWEKISGKMLTSVPKHLKGIPSTENEEQKSKKYFAMRIKNWKKSKNVLDAEKSYNQIKYSLANVLKQLSFCIPISSKGLTSE